MLVNTKNNTITSNEINIEKGLFQGDRLSTLWFCLAINFLSGLLNNSGYGYIIDKTNNTKTSHQLYVDDLKLYAADKAQLTRMLKIVTSFTNTIRMTIGIDKCATLHVGRGKIVEGDQELIRNEETIQPLEPKETYKYLGIQQGVDIETRIAKNTFQDKFFSRLRKILQSKLNAKAMFTSVNSWAMPALTYSFGIVKWSKEELKTMDIKVRALLTKHGIHHPHASANRLYIPRKDGGRGLQNIEITHHTTISEMRRYFHAKTNSFIRTICRIDEHVTPLNLAAHTQQAQQATMSGFAEEWHGKALHGRYPTALKRENVDRERSVTYLKAGYLFPETEGRLAAIQDQVVPTRAYLKNIAKKNMITDKCRKCSHATETIQHVMSSCPILAPREYTDRHNAMAKVYHQELALKYGLIRKPKKVHKYAPKELLQNDEVKLYWDFPLVTDRPIPHNRPDIVIFEKTGRKVTIVDITIPADDNAERAYTEKISKYHDLAFELKRTHKLTYTAILPLIITTNGLVEKHLAENTRRLRLDERLISDAQREVILWTTRILRGFLTSA
ncbi:uncharacterized protein LOC123322308 [Coccinella septempunctata]|uniref:uncharacterized protein LOC123322308 n=1 Tax=Coccinella septempunctata TaxID=41139 RepID=UPI001D05C8E6|nr:uncharacterized protein LOC123322308 [Coccinella septempunctata]